MATISNLGEFTVRVIPRIHQSNAEGNIDNRERFWSLFCQQFLKENRELPPPEEVESKLTRKFGRELRNCLERNFREEFMSFRYGIGLEPPYLGSIFFKVKSISYASLAMSVAIAGLTSLVQLFANHLDAFEMFLDLYVPDAFFAAITGNFGDDFTRYFDLKIDIFEETRQAFNAINNIEKNEGSETLSKTNQNESRKIQVNPWLIANSTLLIPVIFTLIILGFAVLSLNEEKYEFQKMKTELWKEWKELYLESQKQMKELKESVEKQKRAKP